MPPTTKRMRSRRMPLPTKNRVIRIATFEWPQSWRRRMKRGLAVYEGLATSYPSNHNVLAFCERARDLADAAGDRTKMKSFQAKIDELIAAQQKPVGQPEKK